MQYSATMGAPGIGGFNMGIGTGANPPAADFGDVACTTDYVTIPGLQVVINAATINTAATDLVTVIGDRVCGDDWTDGPNPATNANTYVSKYFIFLDIAILFILLFPIYSFHETLPCWCSF